MFTAFDEIEDNLTGGEPLAKRVYDAIWANLGSNYARDGYTDAKVFATARALARLLKTRARLDAQLDPATCLELLPDREREHGVIVSATATIASRRAALAASMVAGQPSTLANLLQAFADLLGADFVDYLPTTLIEAQAHPANPASGPSNHLAPGTPKKVYLLASNVSVLGSQIVALTNLDGTIPTDADGPQAGDVLVFEPEHNILRERCTLVAAGTSPPNYLATTVFTKAHHAGARVVAGRWPYWMSTKRRSRVQLTEDAALDATKRRQVNELMARRARAVSTWAVTGNAGPFVLGESPLSMTPFDTP